MVTWVLIDRGLVFWVLQRYTIMPASKVFPTTPFISLPWVLITQPTSPYLPCGTHAPKLLSLLLVFTRGLSKTLLVERIPVTTYVRVP